MLFWRYRDVLLGRRDEVRTLRKSFLLQKHTQRHPVVIMQTKRRPLVSSHVACPPVLYKLTRGGNYVWPHRKKHTIIDWRGTAGCQGQCGAYSNTLKTDFTINHVSHSFPSVRIILYLLSYVPLPLLMYLLYDNGISLIIMPGLWRHIVATPHRVPPCWHQA